MSGHTSEPSDPRAATPTSPAEGRPAAAASPPDLAAALTNLDRATRDFTRRFAATTQQPTAPPAWRPAADFSGGATAPSPAAAAGPTRFSLGPGDELLQERMREAQREARAYLERAKERADSLVRALVAAVEQETAGMRRDAEADIRARRQQVEADAGRQAEAARLVAQGLVAERQQRLAELSDGIVGRAQALSAGMDDAERVRRQFDAFVQALSATARRIAAEQAPSEALGELDALPRSPRPKAIAA